MEKKNITYCMVGFDGKILVDYYKVYGDFVDYTQE